MGTDLQLGFILSELEASFRNVISGFIWMWNLLCLTAEENK